MEIYEICRQILFLILRSKFERFSGNFRISTIGFLMISGGKEIKVA